MFLCLQTNPFTSGDFVNELSLLVASHKFCFKNCMNKFETNNSTAVYQKEISEIFNDLSVSITHWPLSWRHICF